MDTSVKREAALALLRIKAVHLSPDKPFTWASGIKSPIYCDNRLVLSSVAERNLIENALADIIRTQYPACESLMGTATAGIAHAAICAHTLGLQMGYVRSSAKDHGLTKRVEGSVTEDMNVVVVEDLISTGGSVLDAVNALRELGANVLGIASIFTYNMKKSRDKFTEAGVDNVSVTDFDALIVAASEAGYISQGNVSRLVKFRDNPSDESWIGGGGECII